MHQLVNQGWSGSTAAELTQSCRRPQQLFLSHSASPDAEAEVEAKEDVTDALGCSGF
jgi:hypothetical protein